MTISNPPIALNSYVPSFLPVSSVTPFTYRDGDTFLTILESLRRYVNTTIVPFINDNFELLGVDFTAEVNKLLDSVNGDVADALARVNEAVQTIITNSITANDPMVAQMLADPTSQTRVAIDGLDSAVAVGANAYTDAQIKDSRNVSVRDFGAVGDFVVDDTLAIQAAINFVHDAGGGVVLIPNGRYRLTASVEPDIMVNSGVNYAASGACLILRKGVSLIGDSYASTTLESANATLIIIAMLAPDNQQILNLAIKNVWNPGLQGAGHGIFTFSTSTGDATCNAVTIRDVEVSNVGSYGIGFQAGVPTNCVLDRILINTTGADGLDLKARDASTPEPSGNHCTNITVINHGRRVTGSCGIDVRGVWHIANVVVKDFGNDGALDFLGIRFRTKPAVTDLYNRAGARSTLAGAYIRPALGSAHKSFTGICIGSDYVNISNVVVDGCDEGFQFAGNVNGSSTNAKLVGCQSINASTYGYRIYSGTLSATLVACSSVGSVTAGFRDEGTASTFVGCTGMEQTPALPLSTAASALASQVLSGSTFANEIGLSVQSLAVGRLDIAAKGASSDIDLYLQPKGAGYTRFGVYGNQADSPTIGYVTIKDASGGLRKLAVIA